MNLTVKSDEATEQVRLARHVTVARYRQLEKAQNRPRLAAFLRSRLRDRYLNPVRHSDPRMKSGFAMMAIACLLIETLESFRQGWESTRGISQCAFRIFFTRETRFAAFIPYADSFYSSVRCGILHQGETTQGWRIHRVGPILDAEKRIINADVFLKALNATLDDYCRELCRLPWHDGLWRNFCKKVTAIIENCERPA